MPSPARSEPGRGRRPRRVGCDGGQAAVELALGFPLVCVGLLLLVQVAVVVRSQVAVVHAAREAARAAAVSADPVGDGGAAGRDALGPLAAGATVDVRAGPVTVTVAVRRTVRTDVPLVGALVPDVTVDASAVMRIEP
jgi:Flp pilus assembly protein TadG